MSDNANQTPAGDPAAHPTPDADAAAANAPAPVAAPDETAHRAQRNQAFKDVFWYGLARLMLFLALFAVLVVLIVMLQVNVPLAILAVLALIVAMPASVFLFPKLRVRANEGVATWDANRRAHKAYVREQLAEREAE